MFRRCCHCHAHFKRSLRVSYYSAVHRTRPISILSRFMELVLLIDQIQPHHAVGPGSGKESGGSAVSVDSAGCTDSADSLQWLFARTTAVGCHQTEPYSKAETKMDSVRPRLADVSLVSVGT
jgi:hypothetical protein